MKLEKPYIESLNWHSILQKVLKKLKTKVLQQHGVPTFYDNTLKQSIQTIVELDSSLTLESQLKSIDIAVKSEVVSSIDFIHKHILYENSERYVNHYTRFLKSKENSEKLDSNAMINSQGILKCLEWKGIPLMKSVFDFSIYTQLLWNEKPKTIVEFGSGSGASALWMADLLESYKIDCHIYSVDKGKVEFNHPKIDFIQSDIGEISTYLPVKQLNNMPHPWLIVHDAHTHHELILNYLIGYLEQGDYVIIEDSNEHQLEIGKFLMERNNPLMVDTLYTDYFGKNESSAKNSILTKTSK